MQPVKRRKLYHEVLDQLIEAVSSGEYPPGSQLPSEREMMLRFGVGRPAIREAMMTLQQMGLLRISHGERARVTQPTPDAIIEQVAMAMVAMLSTNASGFADLKEARLLVEVGLVRRAAAALTEEGLERLRAAMRDLRDREGDRSRFVAADLAFHVAIASLSGNALIEAVVKAMLDWLSRFKRDLVSVEGAERLTIAEHERILAALAAREPDAAAAAMRDHLTRADELYARLASP